jgi:hypothetical protein
MWSAGLCQHLLSLSTCMLRCVFRRGIINVRHVGTWATVTYSVVFGLIMATGIGLDLWKLLTGRRHLFTRRQPVQLQAPGGGSSAGGSGSKRGGAGEAAEPHPV